jgi:maltokinase
VTEVRALARGEGEHGLQWVRDVAALVAGMHVALARQGTRPATDDEAQRWAVGAESDLGHAGLDDHDLLRARMMLVPLLTCQGTAVMAVHGDLHIGQVLRSDTTGRYLVIDFDGNPALSPHERIAAQPVARDVAGMLASLDHVGRVVLHRTDDLSVEQRLRVLDWIEVAQLTFLDEYQEALSNAGCSDLLDASLIAPFQLHQECREYAYAARYLPHWRYVPDAALPALLNRGLA